MNSISIDFLSNKASPTAHLQYLPNTAFNVTYAALVANRIGPVIKTLGVATDESGRFKLQIPRRTEALKITTNLNKAVSCFPLGAKYLFRMSGADIRLHRMVLLSNRLGIDTSGLDHIPVGPGENRVKGHQLGPGKASRAMAMAHIAMFEAANSVLGGYASYTQLSGTKGNASVVAAVAQANHDVLVALYPSHKPRLDGILAGQLSQIANGDPKKAGISLGKRSAEKILSLRKNDNSSLPDQTVGVDYKPSDLPGAWRPDPISKLTVALGSQWGKVKPFVIPSGSHFRNPPPPVLSSLDYNASYDEVKCLGGDGINTPTVRSNTQTQTGIYWAYDGTPSLCAPPRLYNQIAVVVAHERGIAAMRLLHLLTLMNVAMADSGIASWESKYFYRFWRPVTAIREAEIGTGPSKLGDTNKNTVGDPNWSPLGAPASNVSNGVNFTPPFPSYPSGHATFGGVLFQILRRYIGTDDVPFTFISDELNGETIDHQGQHRPSLPRTYNRLSDAEEENGQSRIYLGIHWSFDKTAGIQMGNNIANYVFDNLYKPKN